MDKQKMNLDQLYQERFQSFEMEPSSNASALMKNKLKKARTMRTLKWVIAGVITATTIAIITFFSLNTNETTSKNTPLQNNNFNSENEQSNLKITSTNTLETTKTHQPKTNETTNTNQINEDLNDETKSELKTSSNSNQNSVQENHTSQSSNKESFNQSTVSYNTNEKDYYESKPADQVVNKESDDQISEEENFVAVKDKSNSTKSSLNYHAENTDSPNVNLKNKEHTSMEMDFLMPKKGFLPNVSEEVKIEKSSLKLKSRNWLGASKSKFRNPSYQSGSFKKQNPKNGKLDGYFDLHFSPMLWNNQAQWDQPELDTSWTYSLQNSPQLSYELGFAFQLHHQNLPLFLQIGIDYQMLKEKIEYNFTRTFEDTELSYWDYDSLWNIEDVLDTFYIIVDSNHFVIDSIFTQDTLLSGVDSSYNAVISKEEKNKSNVNTYRYLNIPLLLGYEFSSANDKWNFQIMGGAAIAINLKNEGYYYSRDGEFMSYSGKVSPSLVWNLYAAANINYRWKKWQLFAQPEFQYQLNESEISDGIPRRKYQFYKLKMGLRYQLF